MRISHLSKQGLFDSALHHTGKLRVVIHVKGRGNYRSADDLGSIDDLLYARDTQSNMWGPLGVKEECWSVLLTQVLPGEILIVEQCGCKTL